MSISRFFDHSCQTYRLSETPNALREMVDTWTLQAGTELLALSPPDERREDEGAGEAKRGVLIGLARVDANIRETDVLKVTAGPLAPVNLRVLTAFTPQGHRRAPHHLEMQLERFVGVLP